MLKVTCLRGKDSQRAAAHLRELGGKFGVSQLEECQFFLPRVGCVAGGISVGVLYCFGDGVGAREQWVQVNSRGSRAAKKVPWAPDSPSGATPARTGGC